MTFPGTVMTETGLQIPFSQPDFNSEKMIGSPPALILSSTEEHLQGHGNLTKDTSVSFNRNTQASLLRLTKKKKRQYALEEYLLRDLCYAQILKT